MHSSSLSIHLLIKHLGWFHFLVILNSTAVIMTVHVSLVVEEFLQVCTYATPACDPVFVLWFL